MVEANTIEVRADKETENYTVYESADEDTIVGMYIAEAIAEQLGEFATVGLSDEGDENATATKNKDTGNYGVYALEPSVSGVYISHDALGSEETEDGPVAPESVAFSLSPSDESAFEEATADPEAQEDALLAESETAESEEDDEPSVDEQAESLVEGGDEDAESEEVEIDDEEIGLA